MTRLINDLLDVSQVQAGEQLALVLAPTDLAALARAVVAEQQVLGRHTITLRAPQTPVVGYWDAFRLERVLTNVLANAIKYTPDGGHIEVEIIHEREQVAVTIRDSGVGIPAADLPHVFKPYYQAANGPRGNGRGIGLTISQHIIEQHGGVITIHSEERQGTTVQFSLPDGAPGSDFASAVPPHLSVIMRRPPRTGLWAGGRAAWARGGATQGAGGTW